MPVVHTIKTLHKNGETVSAIARQLKLDRKTVRKYINMEDFSPQVPVKKKKRTSILDEYEDIIRGYLTEDTKVWRKQRHTAMRIWERLQDEHGFEGSYETVQRKVKQIRKEMKVNNADGSGKSSGYLPLEWAPGTAQVDFGDVDVLADGNPERWHFLSVSLPYSNVGYAQVFAGESAECVCQGLKDIFAHIGGVPSTIVFDNATGIGRRIMHEVHLCELFERFELHYGFTSRFCNPYSGHEKGNVERKVFMQRSHLFVPVPEIDDPVRFNEELLERSVQLSDREHYRKEKSQMELFEEDYRSLLPLPASDFNACRFEVRKTNKFGHIQLGGCHFYSTRPDLAKMPVTVEIGAHTIRIIADDGQIIATHRRRFGKNRTESIDQSSTLASLMRSPGAWPQCGVRSVVSEPLRQYIDQTAGTARRHALKMLHDLNAEFGFETAVSAMTTAVLNDTISHDNVMVLGARLASGGRLDESAEHPLLNAYDDLLMPGGGAAE